MMTYRAYLPLVLAIALAVPAAKAEPKLEPPVAVRMVSPEYPTALRRQGVSGVVMVSFVVDEQGNVKDPKVEKTTEDEFSEPALEAVKKWKFKPAQRDGTIVPLHVTIPIRFSISS